MLKSIYVLREDGDYDFVAAFDLERIELITDDDAEKYFQDLILSLRGAGEEVYVHKEGGVSDFPDVLSL